MAKAWAWAWTDLEPPEDLSSEQIQIIRAATRKSRQDTLEAGSDAGDVAAWTPDFWQQTVGRAAVSCGCNSMPEVLNDAAAAPFVSRLSCVMRQPVELVRRGGLLMKADSALQFAELLEKGFFPSSPSWQRVAAELLGHANCALLKDACSAVVNDAEAWGEVDSVKTIALKKVDRGCPLQSIGMEELRQAVLAASDATDLTAHTDPLRVKAGFLATAIYWLLRHDDYTVQQAEGMLEWAGVHKGISPHDHLDRAASLLQTSQ